MKLGVFTDDFYPFIGGMGRYVFEITRRMPKENLLIFSPCQNSIANHIRITTPFHVKLRNLSLSLWLHRNIEQIVKTYGLTRINLQCGPGGLFLFKKPPVPVIATCHHTYWQQSHYIPSQFWKRLFAPLERRTYQKADRIVCDSEDSGRILVNKYDISRKNIVVIPIGVDTTKFHPIDNVTRIPKSLLFVGRVDKRKGVDFLIRTMTLLRKKIPNVKLFVVGTGKDAPKLKRYVRRHNLEMNVVFLGHIIDEELNRLYNRVQCLIVPSVFEGFGLTVVEAMAAGTSVIATKVDGLRDLVDDGVNGLLIEYNDPKGLCDRITYLLKNPRAQAQYVREAKRKVKDAFNWDVIMRTVLKEFFGEFP